VVFIISAIAVPSLIQFQPAKFCRLSEALRLPDMTLDGANSLFELFHRRSSHADPELAQAQSPDSRNDRNPGVLGWLSHDVFRKDCLDRKLEKHHITGSWSLS